MANVPIAIALVAIDQGALHDLQRLSCLGGFGEEALGVPLVGESHDYLLPVARAHVQHRPQLGAGKASAAHGLLGEVSPV